VVSYWTGLGRGALWYLWRRYEDRGPEAIFDTERTGRPAELSPLLRAQIARAACTDPTAYGRHLTRWDCRSLAEVVVEQAVVESIHYTTVARVLRAASLQPHLTWSRTRRDRHAWAAHKAEELVICSRTSATLHWQRSTHVGACTPGGHRRRVAGRVAR
jgi:hypothetical protein